MALTRPASSPWRRAQSASMSTTRRPRVCIASLVAYITGSPLRFGRSAAAVSARRADGDAAEPFPQLIGAQKPRWRSWLRHLMRVSRPERWATSSTRIASTLPSAVLATAVARPLTAPLEPPRRHRWCRTCRGPGGPDGSGDRPRSPPRHRRAGSGPGRPRRRRCPPPRPDTAGRTKRARRAARRTRRWSSGTTRRRAPRRCVERGGDVSVEVGVNPASDRTCLYDGHGHPFFCSSCSRGGTHVPGRRP